MRIATLDEIAYLAADARESLVRQTFAPDGNPRIYLHWTAGDYDTTYGSYHINITGDGTIYIPSDDFSIRRDSIYHRNSGSINITLCCAFNANSNNLGDYPPTAAQIETMAQVTWKVADALWLTICPKYVLTHGEAADNNDGWWAHDQYGPKSTVERWDLQYLGTDESSYYTTDYDDPHTGGNVLRGKALWYKSQG